MTKEVMQQALEALENHEGNYKLGRAGCERQEAVITAIKEALAQPPLPVQEPTQWRDMVVVSLVREGVNKHKARELADHFATQPLPVQEPVACRFCFSKKGCWTWQCYKCGEIDDVQKPAPPPVQEPVSMRMPKVGDKVICLEDESLGEVVSLTAGGSPDIKFADGSRGTYLLREFAELFGYAEQRQPLTKDEALTLEALKYAASKGDGRIVREMKIAPFVIKETLAQVEQEPVAWMTINEYGEEDDIHYENPEGHLLEGWTYKPLYTHAPTVQPKKEPPKREWQGLTNEEIENAISDGFARGLDDGNVSNREVIHYVRVIEAALKEKNHD